MNERSVRLLAVSPPCLTQTNRAIYRLLQADHGFSVHLVLPSRLWVGANWQECEAPNQEPFETTLLDPVGIHPRLQRLSGLRERIVSWRPTHVIVDSDPASLLLLQAVRAASALGEHRPQIWSLTAENLTPNPGRDMVLGITSLNPSLVMGPLVTWWLRRQARRGIDRLFTLSSDGTRVMESLGFEGRVTQIPLGFDRKMFYSRSAELIAQTRSRLGLTRPTVGYFGRLIPEKGLPVLLEALASIRDLPWQFLIDRFSAYESSYVAHVKERIESLGLTSRTVYFDATHSEVADYMNAADYVVLPSISTPKWKEQYGRVLAESMACGKIVIGSSTGAIPELIGDAGYTFPEGDSTTLGNLLRQLLTTTDAGEAEALRAKAIERANDRLSADRQAAIWAELALQA